jgi:Kef-type K+ transport system membrane component KefB
MITNKIIILCFAVILGSFVYGLASPEWSLTENKGLWNTKVYQNVVDSIKTCLMVSIFFMMLACIFLYKCEYDECYDISMMVCMIISSFFGILSAVMWMTKFDDDVYGTGLYSVWSGSMLLLLVLIYMNYNN